MKEKTAGAPRETRTRHLLELEEDGSFSIQFQQNARRIYLWVILIFLPLPLSVIASLIFGLLGQMSMFFLLLSILQLTASVLVVVSMRPRLHYIYRRATGLIYYRTEVLRFRRERPFANVRNLRALFVSAQVIGRSRRYLLFQLKGIYADGRLFNLSGFECGNPDSLNRIGETVAGQLEIPFTPAQNNRVSRIIKQLGPKIEWRVENVVPK